MSNIILNNENSENIDSKDGKELNNNNTLDQEFELFDVMEQLEIDFKLNNELYDELDKNLLPGDKAKTEFLKNIENINLEGKIELVKKILNELENNPEKNILKRKPLEHVCNICGQFYRDIISLQDHKLIYHENAFGETFTCEHCNSIYFDENEYYNHLSQFHPENNESEEDEQNEESEESEESKESEEKNKNKNENNISSKKNINIRIKSKKRYSNDLEENIINDEEISQIQPNILFNDLIETKKLSSRLNRRLIVLNKSENNKNDDNEDCVRNDNDDNNNDNDDSDDNDDDNDNFVGVLSVI